MYDRFVGWANTKPVAGLLMIVTAVVLFGFALKESRTASIAFWPWLRQVLEASIKALVFLAMLWAFYAVLDTSNQIFSATHNSLTEANWNNARATWGEPLVQNELAVNHCVEIVRQEEIPREDPAAPPLFRAIRERQMIPQNSIVGFRGQVDMTLSEPEKRESGYALFNKYTVNARYEYDVANDSDLATETEFDFPLSSKQILYESFSITVDGQDVSSQLRFAPDSVLWKSAMQPHQQSKVVVTYTSRGMDSYFYQVPVQREIRNFVLTLTVDARAFFIMVEPQTDLTDPQSKATENQKGTILSWNLDRAIVTPKLGIAFVQPEKPYAPFGRVMRVLQNGPYALVLLGTMVALTLLIWREPIRFLDLVFLSGAYCVQPLVVAGVSDYFLGLWGSLVLGTSLTGLLTYLLFRHLPSALLRILIYVLAGFFTIAYPLSGLLGEAAQRNSFDVIVQVGLIVYLFGLSLYTRIKQVNKLRNTG